MKTSKTIFNILISPILCLLATQAVLAQTEKLGVIQYTPPTNGKARHCTTLVR